MNDDAIPENVRGLLDPRTFPVERIGDLVHALPPPGIPLDVADAPGGAEAARWLEAHGRPARLVPAPRKPRPTRLWRPSPGLLPLVEPPPGLALDLGCGAGRDAVYLALHGWEVTAVDRLPDALDRARALADLHGVEPTFVALDAERDPLPEGRFDLVCAFRYRPSLAKMAESLAPGGSLVVETFTDRERERTGKPRDPALVLPAEGPPPLPAGLAVREYRVRRLEGRELAWLWATAPLSPPRGMRVGAGLPLA